MKGLDTIAESAIDAWRQLAGECSLPTGAERLVIRGKKKSTIFRLDGVGRAGTGVIAKRGLAGTVDIERTIYEQILPELPVRCPYYYGFVREDQKFSWLFLEDIGGEQFSPLDEEHRRAGARWLGLLHSGARKMTAASGLPSRGAEHYRQHIMSARTAIMLHFGNPALSRDDRLMLTDLVSQMDAVESCWGRVEAFCESIPPTLVHGDFQPKNVFVRTAAGLDLFAIDWELSGWGVPAPDLEPPAGFISQSQVDIPSYWEVAREHWSGFDIHAMDQVVVLGAFLKTIAAVDWAATFLAYDNVGRAVARMDGYRTRLMDANRTLRHLRVLA